MSLCGIGTNETKRNSGNSTTDKVRHFHQNRKSKFYLLFLFGGDSDRKRRTMNSDLLEGGGGFYVFIIFLLNSFNQNVNL